MEQDSVEQLHKTGQLCLMEDEGQERGIITGLAREHVTHSVGDYRSVVYTHTHTSLIMADHTHTHLSLWLITHTHISHYG